MVISQEKAFAGGLIGGESAFAGQDAFLWGHGGICSFWMAETDGRLLLSMPTNVSKYLATVSINTYN